VLQLDKWVINTLTNSLTRSHTDTQLYTYKYSIIIWQRNVLNWQLVLSLCQFVAYLSTVGPTMFADS